MDPVKMKMFEITTSRTNDTVRVASVSAGDALDAVAKDPAVGAVFRVTYLGPVFMAVSDQ